MKLFAYLFLVLFLWLAVMVTTGCVATRDYVDERDEAHAEAQTEARVETAKALAEPLEVLVPGISEYAEDTARGINVRPPPPPPQSFPWMDLAMIVAAAAGVSVPVAVRATNVIRDRRRNVLGEATVSKGVVNEPKVMVPA